MYKKPWLNQTILITSLLLIIVSIGIYFYENYQFYSPNNNSQVLSTPPIPAGLTGDQISSCRDAYTYFEGYFSCPPHVGYSITIGLVGLVLFIIWIFLKQRNKGQ